MKITKFVHSCLLVEMPAPINRTALFDPGMMSEHALDVDKLEFLDDIFITHYHGDHMSVPLIKKLVAKFPNVRITAPQDAVDMLKEAGITASAEAPEGVTFFNAPHESVEPMYPQPLEVGINYLDKFSDPGDSHSFTQTKAVLALPVTGPWGSNIRALNLAIELHPQYIVPIHDWHWNDDARKGTYDSMEKLLKEHGTTFLKMETGVPVTIDV
jgi:L-ascorbate metabolism protein UlaG (beta-lactamase superfamily)